jgi:hypothetical protein
MPWYLAIALALIVIGGIGIAITGAVAEHRANRGWRASRGRSRVRPIRGSGRGHCASRPRRGGYDPHLGEAKIEGSRYGECAMKPFTLAAVALATLTFWVISLYFGY